MRIYGPCTASLMTSFKANRSAIFTNHIHAIIQLIVSAYRQTQVRLTSLVCSSLIEVRMNVRACRLTSFVLGTANKRTTEELVKYLNSVGLGPETLHGWHLENNVLVPVIMFVIKPADVLVAEVKWLKDELTSERMAASYHMNNNNSCLILPT
jgi:hypothetical protein